MFSVRGVVIRGLALQFFGFRVYGIGSKNYDQDPRSFGLGIDGFRGSWVRVDCKYVARHM